MNPQYDGKRPYSQVLPNTFPGYRIEGGDLKYGVVWIHEDLSAFLDLVIDQVRGR